MINFSFNRLKCGMNRTFNRLILFFLGYSLKLTYFISPYDLLDAETKTSIPLTVDGMYIFAGIYT